MFISYRIDEHVCIVSLKGNFTKDRVEEMVVFPFSVLEDETLKGIVVNFEQVPHIDSFGLGIVAAFSYGVRQRGYRFAVCCMNGNVEALFQMFHLCKAVELCATEAEAIATMSG